MGGFNGICVALYFIHGNSLHLLRVCYVLDIVLNTFYGLISFNLPNGPRSWYYYYLYFTDEEAKPGEVK